MEITIKLNKKEKRIIEVAFDNLLKTDLSNKTKDEIKELKYKLIKK